MVELSLIGIGSGNPDHLTTAAVKTLAEAQLVLVPFKGDEKSDLAGLRQSLIDAFGSPDAKVVYFDMPIRDPAKAYLDAVNAWHDEIAARWGQKLAEHPTAQKIALLVWGDPSLYDSTLRIAERLDPSPRVKVIPGLTSLQMLTSSHAIPLNTLGGEVLITTGRHLSDQGWPARAETVAVMLDGTCAFKSLTNPHAYYIWWGAYLGMDREVLVSGNLADVYAHIEETRAEAKSRHGWVMDTYLLRKL